MALKLDKDTILEFLDRKKDPLFIGALALILVAGGWSLYQRSALSVDDLIREVTEEPDRQGGSAQAERVSPQDVVDKLLAKRAPDMYNIKRNPFGSQEEQLRKRDEVNNAYNRGVELFQAGDYEAAIQQFDKVITLDVTETRIPYAVLPSEYKRRAQSEFLKRNFDRVLASAKSDLQEGDRLVSTTKMAEAEAVFLRANKNLTDAITADPEGTSVGKENLDTLKQLQSQAFNKLIAVQSTVLKNELQQGIQQGQQLLGQNDLIALLKSNFSLLALQQRLNEVDPNAELIKPNERNQVAALAQQIQKRLTDSYAELVVQADKQFAEALVQKDMNKSKEAIAAMRLALQTNPQDPELQTKINTAVVKRAEMVVQLADAFIAEQQGILNQGQYDQFDAQGKLRFMDELNALRNVGLPSDSNLRTQIVDRLKQIQNLRKPPLLTQEYDIQSIQESGKGIYKIEVMDKTVRTGAKKRVLTNIREGANRGDRTTGIYIKKVDTEKGSVILSKSGYSDVEVKLSPSN
ncbi:MAG: hypothetical protein ACE15F_04690 [bacterium]